MKQLYSLSAAIAEFFPGSGITVSSLRTEARNGRLALTRIAGRDYVTRGAIERMIEQCHVERNRPVSGSGSEKGESPHGLSLQERAKQAQAALSTITRELKKPSRAGSLKTKGLTRQKSNLIKFQSQR